MSDYIITGNAMTIGEKETAQELAKLKQQIEVYKDSDKVLSDTLESRENDILKLNRQFEEHKKFILVLKHPDGQLGSCICPSCISIDKFLAKYRGEK